MPRKPSTNDGPAPATPRPPEAASGGKDEPIQPDSCTSTIGQVVREAMAEMLKDSAKKNKKGKKDKKERKQQDDMKEKATQKNRAQARGSTTPRRAPHAKTGARGSPAPPPSGETPPSGEALLGCLATALLAQQRG